jgi:hypothetical protein
VMVPFAFVCQGLQVQTLKPEAGRRRERRLSPRERCQKLEGEDRGYVGDLRGAAPGLIVCGRKISTGAPERASVGRYGCEHSRDRRHQIVTKLKLTVASKSLFPSLAHFRAFSRATVRSAMVEAISVVVADWLGYYCRPAEHPDNHGLGEQRRKGLGGFQDDVVGSGADLTTRSETNGGAHQAEVFDI